MKSPFRHYSGGFELAVTLSVVWTMWDFGVRWWGRELYLSVGPVELAIELHPGEPLSTSRLLRSGTLFRDRVEWYVGAELGAFVGLEDFGTVRLQAGPLAVSWHLPWVSFAELRA